MKKYLTIIAFSLAMIISASYAGAQNSDCTPVTTKRTAFIMNDENSDKVIRSNSSVTAGDWKWNVLDTFAKRVCGEGINEAFRNSELIMDTTLFMYNTCWGSIGPKVIDPMRITHKVWRHKTTGKIWLVDYCAQPISRDPGHIQIALNNLENEQNARNSNNNEDNNTNQNENDTMTHTVDINVHGLQDAAQNSSSLEWWAILLIVLAAIIAIALIAYLMRPRPAVDQFIDQLEESWRVERAVLRHHDHRVEDADNLQARRNDNFHRESERLRTRYGTQPQ